MKEASFRRLINHDDKSIAHMAARARLDTIYGGALALVYAKRLESMGSQLDLESVASEVYALSSGKWHKGLEAWACPQCGSAHLGQDQALTCCEHREEIK